jgi:uncharacterized protein (DUF885 family)
LILDSGIHSHFCGKWTFLESLEFMQTGLFRGHRLVSNFSGLPFSRETCRKEILNIIARPGYASCYKIGKIFFQKQRKVMESKGMSPKNIHDIFLSRRVPLTFLGTLFEDSEIKTECQKNNSHLMQKKNQSSYQTVTQKMTACEKKLFDSHFFSCC